MWGMKLTGDWKRMEALLKNGPAAAGREIRRATQFNAMKVQREIRQNIRNGKFEPNSSFTILTKRSSKPVVDSGELFKAIAYKLLTDTRAEVGIIKTSGAANYGIIVHEGAVIPVTPAMRGMFYALARYSEGSLDYSELGERAQEIVDHAKRGAKFKPLDKMTTRLLIPGRPFIRDVIEDPALQLQISANWLKAVSYAIAGLPPAPLK